MKLSDATALYVGSDEVTKVYLGEDEVWSKGGDDDYISFQGAIDVGDPYEAGVYFGWSDGSSESINEPFGELTGPASVFFTGAFLWMPSIFQGLATISGNLEGSTLDFQGQTYVGEHSPEEGITGFNFGPEVSTWPTAGTHNFTLKIPKTNIKEGNITVGDYNNQGNILGWSVSHGIGALTGDAADYFYNSFMWGLMGSNYGGYATLSSQLDGSRLLFQDNLYQHAYNPSLGLYGYQFGDEVTAWPASGTHKFWVILPSSE